MKKKLIELGFVEYPLYSVDGWTCYHKKMIWFFVDETDSIIRTEPDVDMPITIEFVENLVRALKQIS